MAIIELEIKTSIQNVNIGGVNVINAETYNGGIPGPTIEAVVGDTIIVRLINDLPYPTGIHWHGIELQNYADGTPVTQNGVPGAPLQVLGNGVPAGGTFLYKFKVPRAGIFWYHPHHHHSTNRVFRGLYGMIVVSHPNEATLVGSVLPSAVNTLKLVLSDITVCKAPGANDAATYVDPTTLPAADRAEWLSGVNAQTGDTPADLCEISPLDEMGNAGTPFAAGEAPNTHNVIAGRSVEGQTVLTNGVNVGGRLGTPAAPGALAPGATTINVQPGQGLRLQIVNCATIRYFRLRLTTATGVQIPLIRVGGEGGVLDDAILEGGVVAGFNMRYETGEILIPTASRADVVAAIPAGATGVLTLWTRDFQRTGPGNPGNWAQLPTVPVLHLNVTGAAVVPAYTIAAGTPLMSSIPGGAAVPLGAATNVLLNPATFAPAKPGLSSQNIQLTTAGGMLGIDNIMGDLHDHHPYTSILHIGSTRYARKDDVLQLTVTNTSSANHPFHLHGFSFQPVSLTPTGGGTAYAWPFTEFRDNINIPAQHALLFRVEISDRALADGVTLGGALGRWLFHCHIFFHAHHGMISELVITDPDGTGSEKPNVNVGGSWAYTPSGGIANRKGTFSHPDGDITTLAATLENGTPFGVVTDVGGGQWEWELDAGTPLLPDQITYVYITATDASGRKDQAVFRLKIGAPDDGSDNGDPHVHTVDGKRYDFQAVGEFVLLRDRDGMEIQTRQTPVLTANPITDAYTGLKSCVSLNTAVAARVGTHRIAYQPGKEQGQLQFFVDGKLAKLTPRGINLDGHRVSGVEVNGVTTLRVDYTSHAVLIVTPHFWTSHNMWYLNISVSHTHADEGLMGRISKDSWLPKLSSGASVGPMPRSLADRYTTLYKTFANSWRVTHQSSLFVYAPGTSTDTFTDKDWPAGEPPCELKPEFEIPGAPLLEGMEVDKAELACQLVTDAGLHQDCVFDVATTGDEFFAEGYRIAQEIRQRGSSVQVATAKDKVKVIVSSIVKGQPTPKGTVTIYVDDNAMGQPLPLDASGRATWEPSGLAMGTHGIWAAYNPADGADGFYPSSSPHTNLTISKDSDSSSNKGCLAQPWYAWVVLIIILIILLIWMLYQ